jgi:hypothetical protein
MTPRRHPGSRPVIAETDTRYLIQYFPDGQLEPILNDWRLPAGELYLVTLTARTRPAKVFALPDFLVRRAEGYAVECGSGNGLSGLIETHRAQEVRESETL